MRIRLTQIDGKLPNLALMKLAHFYRSNGAEVVLTRSASRGLFEGEYDLVLGSQVFDFSKRKGEEFLKNFPGAVLRGTGTGDFETVEDFIGLDDYEFYDYSDYPDFPHSIGFSQRGCRLKCSFCVVPKKEGKVRGLNSIHGIWRGAGHPKQIHLLDAQIVKARDGFRCVQCGYSGVLDCGHLYPRSSFPAGKHLLENQFAQCRDCNTRHIRCPEIFMTWFVETFGQEAHERLHKLVTGPSPSTEQLAAWVKERTELLEQMKSDMEVAA